MSSESQLNDVSNNILYVRILSTFHTQIEYISRRTIRHSAHSNECAQADRQNWKQYRPIRQFHSVHLADITILSDFTALMNLGHYGWKWGSERSVAADSEWCVQSYAVSHDVGQRHVNSCLAPGCVNSWRRACLPCICSPTKYGVHRRLKMIFQRLSTAL